MTFSSVDVFSRKRGTKIGKWRLYPGNLLLDVRNEPFVVRAAKDGELRLTMSNTNPCHQEWVYKRVSP